MGKSNYSSSQLIKFIKCDINICCTNCSNIQTSDDINFFRSMVNLFKEGWRATKSGKCYCPICASKKLK